jgi:hypothetical protein
MAKCFKTLVPMIGPGTEPSPLTRMRRLLTATILSATLRSSASATQTGHFFFTIGTFEAYRLYRAMSAFERNPEDIRIGWVLLSLTHTGHRVARRATASPFSLLVCADTMPGLERGNGKCGFGTCSNDVGDS